MSTKSLVYLDNTIQKYMKDVLIPVIGFRDTTKSLGNYSSLIESLKKDVTSMQIPEKTKIYRLENTEVVAYVTAESEYPIVASIELTHLRGTCVVTVGIPAGLHLGVGSPYIVGCSSLAKELLKEVRIESLNGSNEPNTVYKVYFPQLTEDLKNEYSGGYLTVYSEDRNVKAVKNWEDGIEPITGHIYKLDIGVVSDQDPVPNIDKIVYSDNIRNILGITRAYQKYLLDTKQTVATTLYITREDPQSKTSADIFMKEAGDVKKYYDNLVSIFGKDWSSINIIFSEEISDISEAFSELDITHTPNSIRGENVVLAKGLFKGSNIEVISNQRELLSGMPNLSNLDEFMKDTKLNIELERNLISSNIRLTSIEEGFANTSVTYAPDYWNIINETEFGQKLYLSGKGCFDGVTTLTNANEVPEYWKVNDNKYIYSNMDEFKQFRDVVLFKLNNDLSSVILEFNPKDPDTPIELDELYANTTITHTPMKIVSSGSTTMKSAFSYCVELVSVSDSLLSELPNLEDISGFLQYSNSLTTIPANLLSNNKNISKFDLAFSGLGSITGETPKSNGMNLWELAGTEGYPSEISGSRCFADSPFDDSDNIPVEWK